MAVPIRPDEITQAKRESIPDEVVEAFNELLAKKWNGHSATVKQSDAERLIAARMNVEPREIYDRGWMDIEDLFREAGWKVKYDKPAYNETFEATFEFSQS